MTVVWLLWESSLAAVNPDGLQPATDESVIEKYEALKLAMSAVYDLWIVHIVQSRELESVNFTENETKYVWEPSSAGIQFRV